MNTSTLSTKITDSAAAALFDDTMHNPFMEQPPRKVMKRDHVATTTASDPSGPHGAHDIPLREASTKSQEPRKQQGLVLTRVTPMSSSGTTAAHSVRDTTGTQQSADLSLFTSGTFLPRNTIAGTAESTTEKDSGGFRIPSTRPTRPSTTPKQKPRADYYDFLKKSTSSKDIASSTDEESSDVEKRSTIQQSRKALAASAMEFARKSIMQRANKSPGAAFRRVQDVANDSSKVPSLHDLLMASDADDEEERSMQRVSPMMRPSADPSFAPADMPFTFESTPLPAHDVNVQHKHQESRQGESFGLLDAFSKAGVDPSDKVAERPSATQEQNLHIRERGGLAAEHTVPTKTASHAMGESRSAHDNVQVGSVLRSSMANRAAPYKVPTVNERELLRSSRIPGFRARPVDPKVFTGAGDLGVPRIAKPPLTIPISPKFSQRRVRSTVTPATASTTTAASSRLVNSTTRFNIQRRPAVRQQLHEASDSQKSAHESSDDAAKETDHATARSRKLTVPKAVHSILGPPMRGDGPEAATSSGSGVPSSSTGNQMDPSVPRAQSSLRRPLTQPVPFKFATNELLRKRHVMFQSKETSASAPTSTKSVKAAESIKPRVFKRPQPFLVRNDALRPDALLSVMDTTR
ncbi:hypothetical protein BGZ72_009143 [Mortierella alpina]|nr:hypothetical protein BGZ72_009143 [Mortierella alpina]